MRDKMNELRDIVNQFIKNEKLREITLSILENPKLTFTSVNPKITLEESPAAPRRHHFFPGGLLIHTIAVTKIALSISRVLKEVYGVEVDEDLVVATAILHDIFKYYQYEVDEVFGGYRLRSDWFLSHDYAIVAELAKRGAPDKLIRCLSEVHGTTPITMLESLIVHLADSVDAKFMEVTQNYLLNQIKDLEARYGCRSIDLIIEYIRRYGTSSLFRKIYGSRDTLWRELEQLCMEIKR